MGRTRFVFTLLLLGPTVAVTQPRQDKTRSETRGIAFREPPNLSWDISEAATGTEPRQTGESHREFPRYELYGGLAIQLGGEPAGPEDRSVGGLGWNASFTANVHSRIGITADFDGVYYGDFPRKEGGQLYHYLVGPTFRFRGWLVNPGYNEKLFVRCLLGGVTAYDVDNLGSKGLALKVGAGVDAYGVLRAEIGYIVERFATDTVHGAFISLGLVVPFPLDP